jgi:hypothetical protein
MGLLLSLLIYILPYALALWLIVFICNKTSVKVGSSITKWGLLLSIIPLAIVVYLSEGDGETFIDGENSYGVWLTYVIWALRHGIIFCASTAFIFGLIRFIRALIEDFKSQIGILAGLSLFLILGLVSYFALADSTVLNAYEASGINVTASESVFAGGSIIFVYILALSAVSVVIWAEVSSIFK